MVNQFPVWASYVQVFSTLAIALMAIVIGVLQWRTAQQRAAFELFELRMASFDAIRSVISEVVRSGSVKNETSTDFVRARDKVDFLFGIEVGKYLDGIYTAMLEHHVAETQMENSSGAKQNKAIDTKFEKFKQISNFYTDFPELIKPYVKMHQKVP